MRKSQKNENEKLSVILSVIPKLSDFEKGRLYGIAEYLDIKKQNFGKEDAPCQ